MASELKFKSTNHQEKIVGSVTEFLLTCPAWAGTGVTPGGLPCLRIRKKKNRPRKKIQKMLKILFHVCFRTVKYLFYPPITSDCQCVRKIFRQCFTIFQMPRSLFFFQGYLEKYWYEPLRESVDDAQAAADEISDDLKRQEGQKFLYEAKKVSR